MTALHLSRRRLLSAGAAGLAGAAAGCAADSERADTPRDPESGPPEGALTDVESVAVRRDRPAPFVTLDAETDGRSRAEPLFLVDPSDADALAFEVEPPGTERARDLIETADFGAETVAVIQREVGSCYRLHTEYVQPDDDGFDAAFCQVLRDADVECEAEGRDMVATVLRFPFAYESKPRQVSYSAGGSCESAHWEGTPTGAEG